LLAVTAKTRNADKIAKAATMMMMTVQQNANHQASKVLRVSHIR
jgi:hypothetical protein